ncbi:helix-turn-helix transcriptional regulator [Zavarzinia sp.]|uniref:helix-turn-helix transcriptional regulator n=1 Tax=Zavarzinia sp. TaxID=2027920 RepID=UPI003BB5E98E|nr:helix-turn-helix transcriptional regulator [Zavarzinia sp.]
MAQQQVNGDAPIEQMMLFVHRSFAISSVVFYWVDETSEMTDFRADGAPGDFMHRYMAGMRQLDPLLVSRISSQGKRIARLSEEWQNVSTDQGDAYRHFLGGYGIVDNIDFVFWHEGAPIAGIGLLPRAQDNPVDLLRLNLGAMHQYFEFSLSLHPRLRARRLRMDLRDRYRLSPREIQVAALIGAGASNTDIAEMLNIGVATVKTYVLAILSKLAAENRAGIAAMTAGLGIDAGADRIGLRGI